MILIIAAVISISILLAPVGCVLLWQRYNYFSDGLAHACLFSGIVSHFLNLPTLPSMLVVSIIFISIVFIMKSFSNKNTVISLVSSTMVAVAIIFASKTPNSAVIETMLFGDIFSFTIEDLYMVVALDILVFVLLVKFLKHLVLLSLNSDLASIQKISVNILEFCCLLVLALVVTVTIKNIGALLITALLVMPAATSRIVSTTPTSMIIYSMIFAIFSGILGIYLSFELDWPLASSVAIISAILYSLATCIKKWGKI